MRGFSSDFLSTATTGEVEELRPGFFWCDSRMTTPGQSERKITL